MFEINKEIKDYGLYLNNCISKQDIDYILFMSKLIDEPNGDQRAVSYVNIAGGGTKEQVAVFNKINPVIKKSMQIYVDHFGYNIEEYKFPVEDCFVKTFKLGIGIGSHSDTWEPTAGEPVPSVTVVLYLSSDYEGGEFVFQDEVEEINIKPSAGDVLVFKSNIMHRVTPVISGTRIATDMFYFK
jgi:hypothetical protein